jgi:transcriptional regulator GlxA family with amidase domain
MERARLLLEETTMSVGEIAAALGYSDIFLLSRQFKQHYGYAPSQVRRP